ncbi:peptide ligase PGM1-related protein [Saccharothrix violaceirubra]|uniref:ATP-grasp domain-containing protein n=1 Tax=Saccharothrix violaceirubra TaxID=413306 RepID=A0A7W7WW22_9PSEU|nr:peptide ligase PGM1-related protein [Saccharothrix violaceirubra]MBB4965103.1 hypothetical protein [Saccharothrix violaceirubra]
MILDPPKTSDFPRLQQRLGALFDDGSNDPLTVVVVPSLTLHHDELRKIPGAVHFEQRLLFQFQLLRDPRVRLVYATSRAVDAALVEYALGLVPGLDETARQRLTLLDCGDDSPVPLTAKLLAHPGALAAVRAAIPDPDRAYLVVFTSTAVERELALRLDIPLYACDPELAPLGTKSRGRRLLREAGLPVLPGFEDLSSERELVDALARLKQENPEIRKAVVKLNDSFAGAGNATFSYDGAPDGDLNSWIAARLATRISAPGDSWEGFRDKFAAMGGVVECFLDAQVPHSPSAQLELTPAGGVRVLSTHDQVLGGPAGQTFVGCAFPASDLYRTAVHDLALRAGRELARHGVVGQLSVDFVVDEAEPDRVYALEINLRMGGATAPFMFTHGLLAGHYDAESGHYLAADGRPRCYVTSDRVHDAAFRTLTCADLVRVAREHGLAFDPAAGTGTFYYNLGALPDHGKLGVVAVGGSREDAQRRYDDLVAALRSTASGT